VKLHSILKITASGDFVHRPKSPYSRRYRTSQWGYEYLTLITLTLCATRLSGRISRDLTMVYDLLIHWVSGFCPLPGFLNDRFGEGGVYVAVVV
jgi:hypothetical protein